MDVMVSSWLVDGLESGLKVVESCSNDDDDDGDDGHIHDGRKQRQNIELFCVGDLRSMVDHETFVRLLSSLPTSPVLFKRNEKEYEHESSCSSSSSDIIERYS
eukprot:CAMPEP_0203723144 /NCGR_PEP_ID=MMETSP0092-20131115/6112_1 /ASSEMBLY_ACC=CAM_ASM_001090 /TAXON_ID=426623 /ORGANISM="Chaetoceros affinis, Strain CCMP159" /LENGTH=102 /DNA_ID=CAMNT_0050603431 /DNA_START=164 /DNA_END=468 /DNA_ORIENTATION=+